ncbi:MAG: endonuclease [Frankiales bacterium]|nr:endonuclease [Frankiales bacterium]
MSGQWRGSTRRARLPKDWPAIRVRILTRDGHRCTKQTDDGRCTAVAVDVDHVINGDDHRDSNLTSLCSPHHREKSAREGARAVPRLAREPERHSGLL